MSIDVNQVGPMLAPWTLLSGMASEWFAVCIVSFRIVVFVHSDLYQPRKKYMILVKYFIYKQISSVATYTWLHKR